MHVVLLHLVICRRPLSTRFSLIVIHQPLASGCSLLVEEEGEEMLQKQAPPSRAPILIGAGIMPPEDGDSGMVPNGPGCSVATFHTTSIYLRRDI